jgi:hypothetical protein
LSSSSSKRKPKTFDAKVIPSAIESNLNAGNKGESEDDDIVPKEKEDKKEVLLLMERKVKKKI